VILVIVICSILFLITAGASKVFGKAIGTMVAIGFPLLLLGGVLMAIFMVFLPFIMAVVLPLALFGGAGYLVLRLLGLVKSATKH